MTPLQISKQLRRLSKAMVTLGVAMDYHGGFSEIGQHGRELVNAGLIAKAWATGIEDEHRASKVSAGDTAAQVELLPANAELRGASGMAAKRPR